MGPQQTSNSQSNLATEKKDVGVILPDFKLYWNCYSNQNSMVLAKEKQTHRSWNRIESTEINSCMYSEFIYNKEAKNIQ